MIRQYSWVRFNYKSLPEQYKNVYPFKEDDSYIFFGDIPNMPGHCVVCDKEGKFYIGYHTDNFEELSIEET